MPRKDVVAREPESNLRPRAGESYLVSFVATRRWTFDSHRPAGAASPFLAADGRVTALDAPGPALRAVQSSRPRVSSRFLAFHRPESRLANPSAPRPPDAANLAIAISVGWPANVSGENTTKAKNIVARPMSEVRHDPSRDSFRAFTSASSSGPARRLSSWPPQQPRAPARRSSH